MTQKTGKRQKSRPGKALTKPQLWKSALADNVERETKSEPKRSIPVMGFHEKGMMFDIVNPLFSGNADLFTYF